MFDLHGNALLRDDLQPRGRWAGLSLRGHVSSPDASGARVLVDATPRPESMYYGGQATQGGEHDRRPVVAAGVAGPCNVTVTWPSGIRQRIQNVATGRYTVIDEPDALRVSHRVTPADGRSEVVVEVIPSAAGARVATIERTGAGEWTRDAVTRSDGHVTRVLRAPSTQGEARLRVPLDGTALRVRPRVRFE